MGVFSWILLGLITGWIAGKIVNKTGSRMMMDSSLGVVGAIVGGFLAHFLHIGGVAGDTIGAIMTAVLGAVVVLLAYDLLEASLPQVDAAFLQYASKLTAGVIGRARPQANPVALGDVLDPRILEPGNPAEPGDVSNPRSDSDDDADPTGVGLFDNIALMNADPKFDATVLRRARVALDRRAARGEAKRDDRAIAVSRLPDPISIRSAPFAHGTG
jgi:uncharacterized membrane protein YeaQ/YmgE (transglycosylase-associated protein family)